MSDLTRDDRPEYRNIHITQIINYRLPLAGIVSILHRISGALLFLTLPFLLWLFHLSLISFNTFATLKGVVDHWYVKLFLLALVWSIVHHLCAGVRFLLLDVHVGAEKPQSRVGAIWVLGVSLPVAAAIALKLFGVF
jgi:succinate dehydrogenase / fumarate reductase cytochrome b subunit